MNKLFLHKILIHHLNVNCSNKNKIKDSMLRVGTTNVISLPVSEKYVGPEVQIKTANTKTVYVSAEKDFCGFQLRRRLFSSSLCPAAAKTSAIKPKTRPMTPSVFVH